MLSTWGTRWLWAGVGILVLAGVWLAKSDQNKTGYLTEAVAHGDLEATVAAIGTLRPLESVEVGAQVSGQITRLHVDVGSIVTQGQLLAEIDPIVLQTTVDAGRAELASLRAQLADQEAQFELAHTRYNRQVVLAQRRAVSEEDLQAANAAFKSADAGRARLRAQIEQISSNLKGNEAQLGYTRIYAPINGTVISVEAKQGQTLNATYQTPTLLTIADLSKMTVWTTVSEADIRRIQVDMPAYFTGLAGDGRTWHGNVRQILPSPPATPKEQGAAASTVVQYPVLFDVENTDGELLPQMTAQVTFITDSAKAALKVPLGALALTDSPASNDTYAVRILGTAGKPEVRQVTIGARNRQSAQVLAGLNKGDQVILAEQPTSDGWRLFQW